MNEKKKGYYQYVEFESHIPIKITRIRGGVYDDLGSDPADIQDHWHPEVEIVYTIHGNAVHYIDGEIHRAHPGAVFVVNSNSIHKIIPDVETNKQFGPEDIIAIVVQIERKFLWDILPEMENMLFLAETPDDSEEVGRLITRMEKEFPDNSLASRYEWFHLMSFADELLYRLCKRRLVQKTVILPINKEKNLERLKGIMTWIEEHYQEPIVQSRVAKKFYFTPEYFSRFFHKNTGVTFTDYVARVRCVKAKEKLLFTESSVLDIALDCGFSDARSLINHFHRVYGMTPFQYRKCKKT